MAMHDKAGIEAQVLQWMRDNKKENSRLEFKLLIDLTSLSTRAEFVPTLSRWQIRKANILAKMVCCLSASETGNIKMLRRATTTEPFSAK
jgi:hypothetical protein